MLMLLNSMDKQRYFPRCYVVAATDSMSAAKAQAKEQTWQVMQQARQLHLVIPAHGNVEAP